MWCMSRGRWARRASLPDAHLAKSGGRPLHQGRAVPGRGWRASNGGRQTRETAQAMLDAFIIEEIKRRERVREERERPVAELPLPAPDERRRRHTDSDDDEKPPRGVIIIDLRS